MSTDPHPIDYAFEARLKKASEMAEKLILAGWEPNIELSLESWRQATLATGRTVKAPLGKVLTGREKGMPSEETKTLVLQILEERWKERQKSEK